MTDYGASDTTTTALGLNQYPISEVYVPNVGLKALQGGPATTDNGGKASAPVALYLASQLDKTNDSITNYPVGHTPIAISTATTTTPKGSAGTVRTIRVLGGTLGNVTIYDNTTATGTVLVPTFTPAAGQILLEDIAFTTGLTIVTAAATIIVGGFR